MCVCVCVCVCVVGGSFDCVLTELIVCWVNFHAFVVIM